MRVCLLLGCQYLNAALPNCCIANAGATFIFFPFLFFRRSRSRPATQLRCQSGAQGSTSDASMVG